MNLTTGRQILDAALLEEETQCATIQKDLAIQSVCDDIVQETTVTRKTTQVTLTAGEPKVNLTGAAGLDLFRPELFIKATVGLRDRGEWQSGQTYETDEIVQGDGDPDAFLYRCSQEHLSASGNEPPNADFLSRVYWNPRTPVELVDFETVRVLLNRATTDSTVRKIAFLTGSEAYLDAPPRKAYPLFLLWKEPFTVWAPGTATPNAVTFNMPDDIMRRAISWGAAAWLSHSDPHERGADARWIKFQELVARLKGRTTRGNRVHHSKHTARLGGGVSQSLGERFYVNP
jgi:hypothetical protein